MPNTDNTGNPDESTSHQLPRDTPQWMLELIATVRRQQEDSQQLRESLNTIAQTVGNMANPNVTANPNATAADVTMQSVPPLGTGTHTMTDKSGQTIRLGVRRQEHLSTFPNADSAYTVECWLQDLEHIARREGWTVYDAYDFAHRASRPPIRQKVTSVQWAQHATIEALIVAIRESIEGIEDEFSQVLKGTRPEQEIQPEESMEAYADKVRSMCAKMDLRYKAAHCEERLVDHFIAGLAPLEQVWKVVLPLRGSGMTMEQVLKVANKARIQVNLEEYAAKRRAGQIQRIGNQDNTTTETRKCYYCNKIGHLKKNCMKKKKDDRQAKVAKSSGTSKQQDTSQSSRTKPKPATSNSKPKPRYNKNRSNGRRVQDVNADEDDNNDSGDEHTWEADDDVDENSQDFQQTLSK